MSTIAVTIDGIEINLTRKPIKNAYLRVSHRDGRVRLSVPATMPDQDVWRFVRARREWILRHQSAAAARAASPVRRFVDGEQHAVFGTMCVLRVTEGGARASVTIAAPGTLELRVRRGTTEAQRAAIMEAWYRDLLQARIREIVTRWEPVMGVTVAEARVKRMRTRWGACSIRAKRIWLSLELGTLPEPCLEYVVVHEMNHLLERGHTRRFYTLMDTWMPDWKDRRAALRGRSATLD